MGPMLFNLFISDLDEGAEFADDIKLGGVADTPDTCAAIQKDLDRLENWIERNLMKFNNGKCKVLPVNNAIHQYMLGAGKQPCREGPWGSGGHQADREPPKKAMSILGCTMKSTGSRSTDMILSLHSGLMRHMPNAVPRSRLLRIREIGTYWSEPSKGPQR